MLYPSNYIYPLNLNFPNDIFKLHFIVDRTYEDVKLVKSLNEKMLNGTATEDEKELWKNDLKGAINRNDIERIRYSILYIQTLFNITATDIGIPEFLSEEYCEELLHAVSSIKQSPYSIATNIPLPSHPLNSYEKWNTIESILLNALNTYTASREVIEFAGDSLYASSDTLI